jgi:hypothetical protein
MKRLEGFNYKKEINYIKKHAEANAVHTLEDDD